MEGEDNNKEKRVGDRSPERWSNPQPSTSDSQTLTSIRRRWIEQWQREQRESSSNPQLSTTGSQVYPVQPDSSFGSSPSTSGSWLYSQVYPVQPNSSSSDQLSAWQYNLERRRRRRKRQRQRRQRHKRLMKRFLSGVPLEPSYILHQDRTEQQVMVNNEWTRGWTTPCPPAVCHHPYQQYTYTTY